MMNIDAVSNETSPALWLVRLPQVFSHFESDILRDLNAQCVRKMGRDHLLIRTTHPSLIHDSPAAKFLSWNLPVHHMWPCNPRETEGFVEKAAQTLWRKFGGSKPQTLMAGPLDPGTPNRYFKTLASNLRGRALQLFPSHCAKIRDAETQDSKRNTLFVLVGEEGLFCGTQSPLACNGFHTGGIRHIRQNDSSTISRAGAKIAAALHHLKLHQPLPEPGAHWLELGASPGGMTAELLAREYVVTAIDRAPLDARLTRQDGRTSRDHLHFVLADAAAYQPTPGRNFDAILSDMNGDARVAMRTVCRHASHLKPHGVVVFTLKMPDADSYEEIQNLSHQVQQTAHQGGLELIALTHLAYNRHEFTMILQPSSNAS